MFTNLPVHAALPELRAAFAQGRSAILSAPPGSGKTTVVPLALRSEPWLRDQTIIVLEPRRLAARLAAGYMARQLGEEPGQTVGYRVRFDSQVSSRTKVEVVTEGIFVRRLQNDPALTGVGLVVFDEFHERSLENDLALALCLDVMAGLREDLRLLAMSATLDAGPLSRLLGGAPVIAAHGKMYPVEMVYRPPAVHRDSNQTAAVAANTATAVSAALTEQDGDLLAFLPGAGEIRRAIDLLAPLAKESDLVLRPLLGSLSLTDQDRAVQPDPKGRRRVILATTVAESSITIQGIHIVVDCGWKRVPRFDPNSGLTRLVTSRISRASANQRSGRAGRLGPGFCYRLWSQGVEHGLQAFDQPEILEADLATLALELAAWGVPDPGRLAWIDPPPAGAFAQACALLTELGGLDQHGSITATGKKMATLPLHPRLAHMLLAADRNDLLLACDLAALLSERDILSRSASSADIGERLQALRDYRGQSGTGRSRLQVDTGRCRRVDQVSRQVASLLPAASKKRAPLERAAKLLALAFPDRIAQQRSDKREQYKLSSGRGASLPRHDHLAKFRYLAVADLDAGKRQGRIFLAAPLEETEIFELFADRLNLQKVVAWDAKTESVAARRLTRFGSLVLADTVLSDPDPAKVQAALFDGVRALGLDILPWTDKVRALQSRVVCLRDWQPEGGWPDFSDYALLDSLAEWLGPFVAGVRRRQQLRGIDLEKILLGCLDWKQRQRLEEEAPISFQVPSGSKIKLRYAAGEHPVLAVRLQELFGLATTPTVCGGKVPVVLHLLSPAGRPIQITRDLRGFWDHSYHEVKKELKGRYPKHHWPEDPWQATPTARIKRRK